MPLAVIGTEKQSIVPVYSEQKLNLTIRKLQNAIKDWALQLKRVRARMVAALFFRVVIGNNDIKYKMERNHSDTLKRDLTCNAR